MRRITVQVMAGTVLFLNWTIAVAETAAVPSDYKFLDELVSDLGFQPSELIERVRYLANIPSEAPMQHRFSYCVQGYADRIATDAKLREKVVSEVEERTCAQLGLCHVWTAPSWQGKSSRCVAGRCSHVFGLLVRFT